MRTINERMSTGLHYHRKQLRARLAELQADAESSGFATVVRDIIEENKGRQK